MYRLIIQTTTPQAVLFFQNLFLCYPSIRNFWSSSAHLKIFSSLHFNFQVCIHVSNKSMQVILVYFFGCRHQIFYFKHVFSLLQSVPVQHIWWPGYDSSQSALPMPGFPVCDMLVNHENDANVRSHMPQVDGETLVESPCSLVLEYFPSYIYHTIITTMLVL